MISGITAVKEITTLAWPTLQFVAYVLLLLVNPPLFLLYVGTINIKSPCPGALIDASVVAASASC